MFQKDIVPCVQQSIEQSYTHVLHCCRSIIVQYLVDNRDIVLPKKDTEFARTNWIKDATTDALIQRIGEHPSDIHILMHKVISDLADAMSRVIEESSTLPVCLSPYNSGLSDLLCHICDVVKFPPYMSASKAAIDHINQIGLLTEDIHIYTSWLDTDTLDKKHGKPFFPVYYRTLSYDFIKELMLHFRKNYIDTDPLIVTIFSYFRFIVSFLSLMAKIWNHKYLRMCKSSIRELQEVPFTLAYFRMLDLYYFRASNEHLNESIRELLKKAYYTFTENTWLLQVKPIDALILSTVDIPSMFSVGKDIFSYQVHDTKKDICHFDAIRPEIYYLYCTYISDFTSKNPIN